MVEGRQMSSQANQTGTSLSEQRVRSVLLVVEVSVLPVPAHTRVRGILERCLACPLVCFCLCLVDVWSNQTAGILGWGQGRGREMAGRRFEDRARGDRQTRSLCEERACCYNGEMGAAKVQTRRVSVWSTIR